MKVTTLREPWKDESLASHSVPCQLIVLTGDRYIITKDIISLILDAFASLSQTDVKAFVVRHYIRRSMRLVVDLEICHMRALDMARIIGENVANENSILHRRHDLQTIFSGAILHILSNKNNGGCVSPAQSERGDSKNLTVDSNQCGPFHARRNDEEGHLFEFSQRTRGLNLGSCSLGCVEIVPMSVRNKLSVYKQTSIEIPASIETNVLGHQNPALSVDRCEKDTLSLIKTDRILIRQQEERDQETETARPKISEELEILTNNVIVIPQPFSVVTRDTQTLSWSEEREDLVDANKANAMSTIELCLVRHEPVTLGGSSYEIASKNLCLLYSTEKVSIYRNVAVCLEKFRDACFLPTRRLKGLTQEKVKGLLVPKPEQRTGGCQTSSESTNTLTIVVSGHANMSPQESDDTIVPAIIVEGEREVSSSCTQTERPVHCDSSVQIDGTDAQPRQRSEGASQTEREEKKYLAVESITPQVICIKDQSTVAPSSVNKIEVGIGYVVRKKAVGLWESDGD
jgi:hypothetical protein